MNKSSYSDEEVQHLLDGIESKIDEPLETRTPPQTDNPSHMMDTELQKLKKLVLVYKKKYDALEEAHGQCAAVEEENKALRGQQTILKQMLHTAKEDSRKLDHELSLALQKLKTADMVRSDLEKSAQHLQLKLAETEKAKEQALKVHADLVANHHHDHKKQVESLEEHVDRLKARIEKFAALLAEKDKRIQELQQVEFSLKKSHEQKQLLEIDLDKSYSQSLQLKEEVQKLEIALDASKQHIQQLERANHYLRERVEETHLENMQLQENYQSANTQITTLQQDLDEQKNLAESLSNAIHAEKTLQEEGAEEIKALHGQCEQLRKHVQTLSEKRQADASALKELQKALEDALSDKAQQECRHKELQQNIDEFEKETALIKQTLLKGLRETKELESRCIEAVNEKVLTANKYQQLQQLVEKIREENRLQKIDLQNAEEQKNLLREYFEKQIKRLEAEHASALEKVSQEIQSIKDQYHKAVQEHASRTKDLQNHLLVFEDALKKKEEEINALQAKLSGAYVEKNQLQEQLSAAEQQIEDKEDQLKGTQQHLAKKVKEYAQVSEKAEEQKQQIADLHNTVNHMKERLADLQASLENQQQQEKRQQEQLHETTKSFEVQIAKWEEKYFQMNEKWQASDNRIKELEKYEEKHRQMQALLTNLGSFMGTNTPPPAAPVPEAIVPPSIKVTPVTFDEPLSHKLSAIEPEPIKAEKTIESVKPYQNLFDMPRPVHRPKKDLLD